MKNNAISAKTLIAASIAILSWSSSFVFIRLCLNSYTPGVLALFRYFIVSATLLIFYLRLKKRTKPTLKQFAQLFLLGFFGIGLYMIALNYGEVTVTASIASFIIGLNPIISMLWAMLFFRERVHYKSWLGVGVSVLGLYIIAASQFHSNTLSFGILYIFFAVLCAGIYNVGQKPLLKVFHPIEIATFSAWFGTLAMLVFFPAMIHQVPLAPWHATASVIYLGVIPGAIGYAAWSVALNGEIPASKLVLTMYLLPLFSTLMGWMILDEMPTLFEIMGGCVCLLGALIATRY